MAVRATRGKNYASSLKLVPGKAKYAHRIRIGSLRMRTATQTGEDRFGYRFRLRGPVNGDTDNAGCFNGKVIPSREQGITNENHISQGNPEEVSKLSDSVGFVDPRFGDINGCRATDSNRKPRD